MENAITSVNDDSSSHKRKVNDPNALSVEKKVANLCPICETNVKPDGFSFCDMCGRTQHPEVIKFFLHKKSPPMIELNVKPFVKKYSIKNLMRDEEEFEKCFPGLVKKVEDLLATEYKDNTTFFTVCEHCETNDNCIIANVGEMPCWLCNSCREHLSRIFTS